VVRRGRDRPTAVGIALAWAARIAVVLAFAFIGASKFNSDPRGEWFKLFEKSGARLKPLTLG
jgi:hypothetical protein